MIKKHSIPLLVLAFLILLTTQPTLIQGDPIPKPYIFEMNVTILSIDNIFQSRDLVLNISITNIPNNEIRRWIYPDNEARPNSPPIPFNGSVYVYLDNNNETAFAKYPLSFKVAETQPSLCYTFNMTDMPEGEHTVSVKVSVASEWSIDLRGTSTPSIITINSMPTQKPATEPFPTALVATASVITGVIASAGLIIYFKKRKH